MRNKILPIICIAFWFCSGLYFGTGGYNYIKVMHDETKAENSADTTTQMYGGISFRNRQALNNYLERQATSNLYPLINSFPTPLLDLITIFAFGILGSVTNLVKQIAIDGKTIEELKYVSEPLLGMLTGLVIVGLSCLLPSALATNDIELKPISLMFLSLFSGFFSLKFYTYLADLFGKLFK